MTSAAAQAITFKFDYRFDDPNDPNYPTTPGYLGNNFFDPINFPERRAALEAAADILESRITDDLQAITPSGSNTWFARVFNPNFDPDTQKDPNGSDPDDTTTTADDYKYVNFSERVDIQDLSIPADTLHVFVGGANLGGSTLGTAGPGGYATTTAEPFYESVRNRGETDADISPNPTDFGPWGGATTFNTNTNWNFDIANGPSASNQSDFLSVAIHELAHILGFGISDSWDTFTTGGNFTGPASTSLYGGPVPLTPQGSHLAQNIQDTVLTTGATSVAWGTPQEVAMDPNITIGTRKLFTELDFDVLDDIGWDVSAPPPDPSNNSTAVPTPSLLLGLLGFGGKLASKRRQQMQDDAA